MRFTIIALGVPVFLLLLAGNIPGLQSLGIIAVLWLWLGVPATGYYWFARVVRRAWRDSARAHNRIT